MRGIINTTDKLKSKILSFLKQIFLKRLLYLVVFIELVIPISINAKDSTNVFKVFVGLNYTHWRTKGNTDVEQLSHFSSSGSTFEYKDTVSTSPIIKIIYENYFSNRVSFYVETSYNYSKLSYTTSSYNASSYPPYWSSYLMKEVKNYNITPNSFMLSLGPKINIKNFYLIPKFDFSYYTAKSEVLTSTYINSSYSYPSVSTNITFEKENFSSTGFGGGLALGYTLKSGRFPVFIQAQTDYIVASYNHLKTINACVGGGIGF